MKKMFIFFALILAALLSKAQDSTARKPAKDTTKKVEKPIADSVEYISNGDLKGIYRYISDRTSGTQYFEIFLVLDQAIQDAKQKAAARYRKRKR